MELKVSEVAQAASSGSYVVKYDADVQVTSEDVVIVEVIDTIPEDADRHLLSLAVEYIRRGAESVLRPRSHGAIIRVRRLVIHPVDCKPPQFECAMAKYLAAALADDTFTGQG